MGQSSQAQADLPTVDSFPSQVYSILDEYILAGEIQETSKREILERVRESERYEKAEMKWAHTYQLSQDKE